MSQPDTTAEVDPVRGCTVPRDLAGPLYRGPATVVESVRPLAYFHLCDVISLALNRDRNYGRLKKKQGQTYVEYISTEYGIPD